MLNKILNYFSPHYLVSLSFIWSFTFFLINNAAVYNDYDTFWHIEAGSRILTDKKLILLNGWSFTEPNHYWYNISWLWDLALYFIEEIFSVKGIYYFSAIFYALIVAAVTYYLLLHKDLKPLIIIFTIFLITLILWDFSNARPYAITILFSILYLIILKKYELTHNAKQLILLPIIMLIWVNTHGGFVAGAVILVAKGLEIIHKPLKKWDWKFFIYSAITAICILINPYSYKIILAVTSTTSSKFTQTIDEWQSFSLGKGFFVFSIYLFLFIISFNIKNKNISFLEKFISIIWLAFSLMHVRNINLFVVLSSGVFASNIQQLNILRQIDLEYKFNNKLIFKLCCLCFIAISSLPIIGLWKNIVTAKVNPYPPIKFIMDKYPKVNFFNDYAYGGAIIYFSNGKQKVFVDGRAGTAYSEDLLFDFRQLPLELCGNNSNIINKYSIGGLITRKSSPMSEIILKFKNWRQVYSDNHFVVYIKTKAI